jgi:hypothetical protein
MALTSILICDRVSNTNVYVDWASEVSSMPRATIAETSRALAETVGALLPLAAARVLRRCGGRN